MTYKKMNYGENPYVAILMTIIALALILMTL